MKCEVCKKEDIDCSCDDKEKRLTDLVPKRYCKQCGQRLKYHCVGYVCKRCNYVWEQEDTIKKVFWAWLLRL